MPVKNKKRYIYKLMMITFNIRETNEAIFDDQFRQSAQNAVATGKLDASNDKQLAMFCANYIIECGQTYFNTAKTSNKLVNAYFVLHDKDVDVDGKKAPHVHLVLEFAKALDLNTVWNFSHLTHESSVEKPHTKGRYQLSAMLAYLSHRNYPEKYQYDFAEVQSASFNTIDYQHYANTHEESWLRQGATNANKTRQLDIDYVLDEISDGHITQEQIMLTPELRKLHARNASKMNIALQDAEKSKSAMAKQELDAGDYGKNFFFIYGSSGSGKSQLLSCLNANLKRAFDFRDPYHAKPRNPFEGYTGEQLIAMDDFKADQMENGDWLTLTDPHSSNEMHCRFYDRYVTYHAMGLTSTQDPYYYFAHTRRRKNFEDLNQFLRRIGYIIEISTASEFKKRHTTKSTSWDKTGPYHDADFRGDFTPGGFGGDLLHTPATKEFITTYSNWLDAPADNRRVISVYKPKKMPKYLHTHSYNDGTDAHGYPVNEHHYEIWMAPVEIGYYPYIAPTDDDPYSMFVTPDFIKLILDKVAETEFVRTNDLDPEDYIKQSPAIAEKSAELEQVKAEQQEEILLEQLNNPEQ